MPKHKPIKTGILKKDVEKIKKGTKVFLYDYGPFQDWETKEGFEVEPKYVSNIKKYEG